MGHFNNQFLFHSLTSLSLPKQCSLCRSEVMSRKPCEKNLNFAYFRHFNNLGWCPSYKLKSNGNVAFCTLWWHKRVILSLQSKISMCQYDLLRRSSHKSYPIHALYGNSATWRKRHFDFILPSSVTDHRQFVRRVQRVPSNTHTPPVQWRQFCRRPW